MVYMTKMKSRICAGLLAVLTLAGASAALGVAHGINAGNSLSITADAATVAPAKKLTNNAYLTIYDTNSSNVLKGYIDGKFTLKSVTGATSIIKSKQIKYDSKTNRTNVTVTLNVKPYNTYKAYFNGTVKKGGKTSNMKFIVENHLHWTADTVKYYGVGYKSGEPEYQFIPESICDFPSGISPLNSSVVKLSTIKNSKGKITDVSVTALKAGTVDINKVYSSAGVLYTETIKVVSGKVYKSNKTLNVKKSWTKKDSVDIRDIQVSNNHVYAVQDFGKDSKTYTLKGLSKGTAKVTVWYMNGSRSEITVTVK